MKAFFIKNKRKIAVLTAAVLVLAIAFFEGTGKEAVRTETKQITSPSPNPSKKAEKEEALPSEAPGGSESPEPKMTPEASPFPDSVKTEEPKEETGVLPSEQTFYAPEPEEKKSVCILTVRCDEILNNMDKLNPEKKELIPADGIIFSGEAEAVDGESVFDLLQRKLQAEKIHMEFVNTPATNSAYVKGINNIYEFDCGGFSGWTYTVNGKTQSVGCSQCFIHPGDTVEWKYVCELPPLE